MFEKLKKIFSETAKNLSKKSISKKEIDSILGDLQISLMENDVAHEIVEEMTSKIKMEISDLKLEGNEKSDELITTRLYTFLHDLFLSTNNRMDIIQSILEKKKSKAGPYSIIFLGINGTGKTTTIAKFCKMLRDHDISVVLAAGDTHRAGAIEQIMYHGNNLNVKVISQRYGADPSAVARDALEHAKKNYVEVVLIDTAGRMQTSKNLMEEVSKIIRVIKPDLKLFVGDSLAGNDTVNQAREFFQYTNYDGSILTKSDADSRGGAAISIAYLTHKPILYLGVGQGYEDLDEFDYERFLNSIFKDRVYEKNTHDLRKQGTSNPDTHKISELTQNENIDSPTDKAIDKSTTKDADKYLEEKEALSTSVALMPEAKDIGYQDQLITEQLNNDKEYPKERTSKETSETKPKKGSFFNKLFKDRQENDLVNSNTNSQVGIRARKDKNKEETESKNESEEVVYLTDDDIDELLK
ncbi:MAG TPA: signal recognition particle-docking protein FtsY [Nitrososphaeraceae archaeon]